MGRGGRVKDRDDARTALHRDARDRAEVRADPLRGRARRRRVPRPRGQAARARHLGRPPTGRRWTKRWRRGISPARRSGSVRVDPDLGASVEALLAARVVELIALARKAGLALAGLEKTKAALVAGQAALLVQAADGSARGRAALRPPEGENSLVSCLLGAELGLAFARDSVIHAAVLAGGLAERIRDEARRLSGLRGTDFGAPSADGRQDDIAEDAAAGEGFRPERQTTE